MIKREKKFGECAIQKKNDSIYDTETDHYLEDYLEEIIDME